MQEWAAELRGKKFIGEVESRHIYDFDMPHIASEVDKIGEGDAVKAMVRTKSTSTRNGEFYSLILLNSRIQGCRQTEINSVNQTDFHLLGKAPTASLSSADLPLE